MTLTVSHSIATVLPPMPRQEQTLPPTLVMLGRDQGGKPHASAFEPDDAPAAERAAGLMGFRTFVVADEHKTLASSLPRGRVFESGRAFVPFCSKAAFERLLAAAGLPDTPTPIKAAGKPAEPPPAPTGNNGGGGAAGGAGGAAKPPFDWADIAIGSLVLAPGDEGDDGYYAAKIIATKADQNFVLRWVHYPDLMEFTRHRNALGLLHPGTPKDR